MGDRAQVQFIENKESFYLYTHWDGRKLPKIVMDAIESPQGRARLDDCEYLARIIFSRMIKDDIDGKTGYGIGRCQHGDVNRLVVIDYDNNIIETVGYTPGIRMKLRE